MKTDKVSRGEKGNKKNPTRTLPARINGSQEKFVGPITDKAPRGGNKEKNTNLESRIERVEKRMKAKIFQTDEN